MNVLQIHEKNTRPSVGFGALACAISAAILALSLSGCSAAEQASSEHSGHSIEQSQEMSQSLAAADIMFAQMMIPHHQQAIDMALLAETHAGAEEVKKLAAEIKGEQSPEVELMKSWLSQEGVQVEIDHSMTMPGLLSASQMESLAAATGDQFDKLFLLSMIEHHKGAIEMAQNVLTSTNVEVQILAESIILSQTEQIAFIQSLLNRG